MDIDGKYSVGKIFKNKKGEEFEIIEKLGRKRKIKFILTGYENIIYTSQIQRGTSRDNSIEYKYAVGKIFITNEGCEIEIIENLYDEYRIVRFLDEYKYETKVQVGAILKGNIKNPFKKSVFSIGYIGSGVYNETNNIMAYSRWGSMLERCYSKNKMLRHPSYKDVTVCEEWLNFQNFAEWYENTFPKHIKDIKFHLDKDLLQQGIEDKIYSPNTCIWLPQKINNFIHNKNNKYTGLSWKPKNKKWEVTTKDFETNKNLYLGIYKDKDIGANVYKINREVQAKKARNYLKTLGYLSDEICELIK